MRLVQSKNRVHGLLHFSSFFLSSYAPKGSFYLGFRVPRAIHQSLSAAGPQ